MKLKDLFPIVDQFKYIQGIEGNLRRRRRNGLLATIATVGVGIIQLLREVSLENEAILAYLSRVAEHTLYTIQLLLRNLWLLITLQWESLQPYQIDYHVLGFYVIVFGILIYFLNRHTAFLFKISEEPFQYTFWIDRFNRAEDREENETSITADDRIHHLLHHDLMDMLNRRIGRFSLLDEKFLKADGDEDAEADDAPPSHIHIDGHYAILETRTTNRKEYVKIRVMPRVRIGAPGNPSLLTPPVEVEVEVGRRGQRSKSSAENGTENEETAQDSSEQSPKNSAEDGTEKEETTQDHSDGLWPEEEDYEQILEQVYSKVASEIYRQIRSDIKQKMHLFPTKYLRAVALYYEAEDFSRSSTIDAYDYAIELYRDSLRYYEISFRSLLSNWLLRLVPLRFGIEYVWLHASTKIGYAQCLVYRRVISSLSGRAENPLYEVPAEMHRVVERLIRLHNKFHIRRRIDPLPGEHQAKTGLGSGKRRRRQLTLTALTYEEDTWKSKYLKRKLDISRFERVRRLLFRAYVVLALTYAELGAIKKAKENLEYARATYPERCDHDALFLLAKAQAEPDLEQSIPLLTQATESAPDFEIAQYRLAKTRFDLFLSKGEVSAARAKPVTKEFGRVLKINPSNVASFANCGYLHWLIDELGYAKKQFERGIDTKARVQQTYIGELNYGLARIAAKEGDFNECYDRYHDALSSEPSLGAHSSESVSGVARLTSYYDYITPSVMKRYEEFKRNFENQIRLLLVGFHKEDLKNLKGLKAELEKGGTSASRYIREAITEALHIQSSQITDLSADVIVERLNALLDDGDFHNKIVQHDKSLGQVVDDIKQGIYAQGGKRIPQAKLNQLVDRLVLEKLYDEFIRPIEKYFEGPSCWRQNFEDGRDSISIDTLNKTYSYVLNDYGNACLNFSYRHGNPDEGSGYLNKAVKAYEKSIDFNRDNGIVHYNIAKACGWRDRGTEEGLRLQKENLEKANELMLTSWPRVVIELVRCQVEELIPELESKREEVSEADKARRTAKKNLEECEDRNRKRAFSRKAPETASSFPDAEELTSLREDLKKKEGNLSKRESELSTRRREFENKLISATRSTVEPSGLAAVIEGYGIDATGSAILRLRESKIEPDRFSMKDMEALRGWSDLLGIYRLSKPALENAVRLCEFLAEYAPPTFEIDWVLFNAYLCLESLELESEEYRAQSPYIRISEIRGPGNLLARMVNLHDKFSENSKIDSLLKDFSDTTREWMESGDKIKGDDLVRFRVGVLKEKKVSNEGLALELAPMLNRLIERPLYKAGLVELEHISPRTREMIEFEAKLKGRDLVRFNRMLLEEVFPEEIAVSQVERYRERICETIRDYWLASDPIHYLALDEWAWWGLVLPEMERCLKEAIRRASINVDESHERRANEFHDRLANLYLRPGYEDDALQYLEQAIKDYDQQGIYHLKRSQALRGKGMYGEARDRIREAAQRGIITETEYGDELKEILKDEAQALRRKQEYDDARDLIREAAQDGIIDETEYDDELKEILKDEASYLAQEDWGDAITKYQEALEVFPTDEGIREGLERAIQEYKKQKIARHYGEEWLGRPLVATPIIIEIANDLIPLVADEQDRLTERVQRSIDQMRGRVLDYFGVRVPGIRFRGIEADFKEGTYVIMINEIPLASGSISLGKCLYIGPRKAIEALNIHGDETINPVTDEVAYWIDEGQAGKLRDNNMQFWEGEEYLIRHLEAILQRNLVEFLGPQEVYNLISEKLPEKREGYDSKADDLIRLTAVLRGLVGEKVPITAFQAIVEAVEQRKGEPNLSSLINEVRLLPEVRKDLPGNRKIAHRFRLSARIEDELQDAVYEENGQFALAMPRKRVEALFAVVRNKSRDRPDEAVIVADPRLRPLVSQLLRQWLSNTSVISQDEMLDTDGNALRNAERIDFG